MASPGETFGPGLFCIGLNFERKPSNHHMSIESKQLTRHLERKPIYLKPALRNLLAVLTFHMNSGRTDARLMLEELITEYPNDLNVLADLIYVYKNMGRERDSDRYAKQLEEHKDDPLLQARSILSQAHALTFDLPDDYITTPSAHLRDTWRLLNMKDKHLEQVRKANNLVVEAYKLMQMVSETTPYQRQIDAREIAVEKFETGIEMLEDLNCSKEEILVWKHNLGIARASLNVWRKKRGDPNHSRYENCIKVLEAHLDVIENAPPVEHLEEPLKKCVAKSCIFFCGYYWTERFCIDPAHAPQRISRQDCNYLCQKAMSICPEDPGILLMCAKYLSDQRKYVEALELFDRSISLNPDIDTNWKTFSFRMDAYYFYSLELSKSRTNAETTNKYLELAYKDGKLCLQSKCKVFCMTRLAQVCFQRAMPDDELGGQFHCQHIDYIFEALEILYKAMNKQDVTYNGKIESDLGKYYPYIGEYRKAVECLKTALELNKWARNVHYLFSLLCKCFAAFYERENDKNLLSEFRFMLKEAKKRRHDRWVTDNIGKMCNHYPRILTDLVENMIEWDVRGCKRIIEEVLGSCFDQNLTEPARTCQNLRKLFETKLKERNNQDSDINGPTEIQKSPSTENFEYDFFVWHSENDADWVNCMLRPRLEEMEENIRFKGFIPSRDFIPGEKVIDSLLKGIAQSRKLLIVVTPNYLVFNWQKYCNNEMLSSAIAKKGKEKTIIPIMLEGCNIPDKLKAFPPILFTEKSDWEQLQMSLTVTADSE